MMIGVDITPSFQQIAFLIEGTGEYRGTTTETTAMGRPSSSIETRSCEESTCEWNGATGYSRWFERLLAELGFEVWIGDPAEIKPSASRKQKTDRKDAQLLLKLMIEDRFPRIRVPSPENGDVRVNAWHRHRLVQMRTRIMISCRLWRERGPALEIQAVERTGTAELEKLALAHRASRRRRRVG